mgnify:CR=1 FL=1
MAAVAARLNRLVTDIFLAAGVPVELSLTAGAFLCNQVMYTLLHHLALNEPATLGGFIHLPGLQVAQHLGAPLATLPAHWIPGLLKVLKPAFPQFSAGNNVLCTSLENIGAVFHPALTIMNAGWIEATHGDFDYYLQGITPAVAKVLQGVDAERLRVASALGIRTMSAREWLYVSYDSPGRDLCEAIRNTESYRGIRAPQGIAHRYISEDVPFGLVPLAWLGDLAGVSTPISDAMIDLASLANRADYRRKGLSLKRLGLGGLDPAGISRRLRDGV